AAVDGAVTRGPEGGTGWTLYKLGVIRAYKGRTPSRIKFYTPRDSGGFYMDRAWVPLPKGHDVGGEYLFFLSSEAPAYKGRPPLAAGAMFVNYNCGQSKRWADVPKASRRLLQRLSHRD